MEIKSHLLEFYGTECAHCKAMEPIVARLEEEGISFERYEVWHNEENAKLMRQYDQGHCGGTPFFYNTKTEKWICGNATYEKLKEWAVGK
jgi:thiol-disulfide isomerase/thioredoxin